MSDSVDPELIGSDQWLSNPGGLESTVWRLRDCPRVNRHQLGGGGEYADETYLPLHQVRTHGRRRRRSSQRGCRRATGRWWSASRIGLRMPGFNVALEDRCVARARMGRDRMSMEDEQGGRDLPVSWLDTRFQRGTNII